MRMARGGHVFFHIVTTGRTLHTFRGRKNIDSESPGQSILTLARQGGRSPIGQKTQHKQTHTGISAAKKKQINEENRLLEIN